MVALDYLTHDLAHAPTSWLIDMLQHLDMIRRADVIMRGEQWELSAVQDEAARATDALLLELGRRIHGDEE